MHLAIPKLPHLRRFVWGKPPSPLSEAEGAVRSERSSTAAYETGRARSQISPSPAKHLVPANKTNNLSYCPGLKLIVSGVCTDTARPFME